MNKEEIEAIEELKEEINKPVELPEDKFDTFILFNIESAKAVLNYIDKLEKENNKYIEEQNNVTIMETEYFKDKYISKDTIREILKINTIESISCDNNYKEPLLHLRKEIYDLIGVKNESSNRRTEK